MNIPHAEIAQEGARWREGLLRQQMRLLLVAVVVLVVLAVIPLVSSGSYNLGRYQVAMAYITVAIGMNLAFGYCGELVLGYPTIMAVSAYTAGILGISFGWSLAPALACGLGAGIGAGMFTMIPGLRVRGWYLALITLFSVVTLPQLVSIGEKWTGGEYGLTLTPLTFGGKPIPGWVTFNVGLAMLALTLLCIWNLLRSGWSLRMRALRDAPSAASAVGLNPMKVRLTAYLISSVPAALAGLYLAYSENFVNASAFNMSLALLLLTGVVLGGAGTLTGPIVGMLPLLALSFWVGPFSPYNAIALGVGLLAGSLLFPDGVVPVLARMFKIGAAPRLGAAVAPHGPSAATPSREAPVQQAPVAPVAPMVPMVQIEGVRVRFGANQVLDGVGLTLARGSLTGLVGPNGSGKSTLLNAISGFIRAQEGSIRVGGQSVEGHAVHELARAGIGRTFQIPQLIEDATALENIELGLLGSRPGPVLASVLRLPRIARQQKADFERALEVFAEVGLPASALSVTVAELPIGLKRVVEIGRAIVHGPHFVLIDEPAAGLNDAERHQLGRLLRSLKQRGITILVVEHNVSFVMQYCDELVLLEGGRITAHASTSEPLPENLSNYLSHSPEQRKAA